MCFIKSCQESIVIIEQNMKFMARNEKHVRLPSIRLDKVNGNEFFILFKAGKRLLVDLLKRRVELVELTKQYDFRILQLFEP